MNRYIAFYRSGKIEVEADTSFEAQRKAAVTFRAKKSFDVSVVLHEKDIDTPDPKIVVHSTAEFG